LNRPARAPSPSNFRSPLRIPTEKKSAAPANNALASSSPLSGAMDKIPFPSVERPFGIELWPIFDKGYELVTGSPAHDFHFQPGYSALSTIPAVVSAIVAYYAIIWAGHKTMKTRQPMKLNGLFMAHNLFLTVVSAGLLVLFIEQLFPILWQNGVFYSICSPNCWTQKIVTLYYVSPTTRPQLRDSV
jgi:hypothetical protein